MQVIIPKNTTLPAKKRCYFTTSEDNINYIVFQILEGDYVLTKANNVLTNLVFEILPAPRLKAQIEVVFDIDEQGILSIIATETLTKKCKQLQVTHSSRNYVDENKPDFGSHLPTLLVVDEHKGKAKAKR